MMSPTSARKVVLVSGPPGAGKTTVAEPLAAALGFALLSKDPIKEALFDALDGRTGDLAQSRKFSDAAIEVMLALAAQCPQVVLEANFHPHNARERERIRNLGGEIVEVYCSCPPEEMARRYAERAASTCHHPAHALKSLSSELLAEYGGPVGIGAVITIDTIRPVNTEHLVRRIQEAWSE
jgi:predicted kinase